MAAKLPETGRTLPIVIAPNSGGNRRTASFQHSTETSATFQSGGQLLQWILATNDVLFQSSTARTVYSTSLPDLNASKAFGVQSNRIRYEIIWPKPICISAIRMFCPCARSPKTENVFLRPTLPSGIVTLIAALMQRDHR